MAELSILDVGHGNCAVLFDTAGASVFDAPRGDILLKTLKERGVSEIALVVVSHADADHLGGILSLLLNYEVKELYINPDASKHTELWHSGGYLSERPARGKMNGSCCAGTVVLGSGKPSLLSEPLAEKHREFIDSCAEAALCKARAT